jgi:hypothetical protein
MRNCISPSGKNGVASTWDLCTLDSPARYFRQARWRDGRIYVSWNGATEVATWVLESVLTDAAAVEHSANVDLIEKTQFEHCFRLKGKSVSNQYQVTALDQNGRYIGRKGVIDIEWSHWGVISWLLTISVLAALVQGARWCLI